MLAMLSKQDCHCSPSLLLVSQTTIIYHLPFSYCHIYPTISSSPQQNVILVPPNLVPSHPSSNSNSYTLPPSLHPVRFEYISSSCALQPYDKPRVSVGAIGHCYHSCFQHAFVWGIAGPARVVATVRSKRLLHAAVRFLSGNVPGSTTC